MISAVVLTKNEEMRLERCLTSLSFVDEIIVIDDFSTDRTLEIAKQYNAKVVQHALQNNFAQQRNVAMQHASGDWIIYVDADEEVSKELSQEISALGNSKNSSHISAYSLRRRDYFWGKELKYGEVAQVYTHGLVRLVKKSAGTWEGAVHEEFRTSTQCGRLNGFLNHYPHQTVKEFIHDINIYSSLRAKELYNAGTKASVFELIAFPCGKFIWTYFFKRGFLDGPAGFVYAFFMSFHSFLVRAKLFQYGEKK